MNHNSKAFEFAKYKEYQEGKIKQLEEIEQRMVTDLQRTLARKNDAVNGLQEKSNNFVENMLPTLLRRRALDLTRNS